MNDRQRAFNFILYEDSQKLRDEREELNFLTNQCLDEMQRIGSDEGELLKDHFITMS